LGTNGGEKQVELANQTKLEMAIKTAMMMMMMSISEV